MMKAMKNSILIAALAFFYISPALGQTTTAAVRPLHQTAGDTESLLRISPNKEAGFNYAYFLLVPPDVNKETVLLVVPNNTGIADDSIVVHEAAARKLATEDQQGYSIAIALKIPLLVPVFPRPYSQWKIETHALNRTAMLLKEGEMERIDLQLLAMIADAHRKLEKLGLNAGPRVFLSGFSDSGLFSNRFTFLHPERVMAVASGGVNGICMLPLPQYENSSLLYPLGIADYETITGHPFDVQVYRTIPQFIYMGEKDEHDPANSRDLYSEEETSIIYKVLGRQMLPTRFKASESFYHAASIRAEFKTYPCLGHDVDTLVFKDVCAFFSKHMAVEDMKKGQNGTDSGSSRR